MNANFLPASQGLTLGSQNQPWNIFANVLNQGLPVNMAIIPVVWSASPTFSTTSLLTVFNITLSGSTTATYNGVPGLVLFQITQDSIGGRAFTWPSNFLGPMIVGPAANQVSSQFFYFDGSQGWPFGPGVLYP